MKLPNSPNTGAVRFPIIIINTNLVDRDGNVWGIKTASLNRLNKKKKPKDNARCKVSPETTQRWRCALMAAIFRLIRLLLKCGLLCDIYTADCFCRCYEWRPIQQLPLIKRMFCRTDRDLCGWLD
jgi:hypothetical protein